MELQNIVYEKSEGVGTITLNRPGKLNAITFEMLDDLWALLQEIMVDEEVHVILLKGEGRYFCAGADLGILGTLTPETFRIRQRKYWNRVFNEFEDIQKLTIAALNGPALGGGVELALCCDMRYAVEDATFALPEINFGILPDSGGTIRLPGLIGLAYPC
jgi:enoyl-CoA hydratase/carnithine racemase